MGSPSIPPFVSPFGLERLPTVLLTSALALFLYSFTTKKRKAAVFSSIILVLETLVLVFLKSWWSIMGTIFLAIVWLVVYYIGDD
jgi:hypothetical protein